MFIFLKKILILSSIFSSAFIFCVCPENEDYKKLYDSGYPIEKHHLMQAYNAPARVNTQGYIDVFVQGSFLYWQPKEKGLTIGASTSLDLTKDPVKIFNFDSNFKTGFKAGLGFHTNEDNWTCLASYIRFDRDLHTTINQANAFQSEWIENLATQVSAKWNLNFNMFALSLSRDSYNGKQLILSPRAEIIGGWIDQKYKVSSISNAAKAFSESWFVGPKAGATGFWKLRGEFKVLTDISAALLYQDFYKVSYEEQNISTLVFSNRIILRKHYLVPNLNLGAGFNYGSYFFKDKCHIDLLVKYEFMHFWNQNQMKHLLNLLSFTRFNAGSLMLHGITMSMRLDF